MKKISNIFLGSALLSIMFSAGCKKDKEVTPEPVTPAYTVPSTYNAFKNVEFAEATTIIGMTTELSSEIAKGTGTSSSTIPTPLDATHLKNLIRNQGNPFIVNPAYNTSGFQILNNCMASTHSMLESFLDTLAEVSKSGKTASSGVAGLGLSKDASPKRYLLTGNGINYSQMLNKNLMSDLVLYQIASRITDNTSDNSTLVAGKNYTAMEHTWDMAFGFWSVPDSFPTVKTPVKLWGSYSNQVDKGLGCNKKVMDAFLKGRAAISNKDMATKNEQAAIIIAEFDKMTAGAVIHEMTEINIAIAAGDQVKINNLLSECLAFVMSMKDNKNTGRIITDAQIATLLGYFPANHWNVTPADLNNIKSFIATVYGFTPNQMATL